MFRKMNISFPTIDFQGRFVSFREGRRYEGLHFFGVRISKRQPEDTSRVVDFLMDFDNWRPTVDGSEILHQLIWQFHPI